jgi:hypothetical protein
MRKEPKNRSTKSSKKYKITMERIQRPPRKASKNLKLFLKKDYITPFEPNRAINAKEELRDPFHIMDRGSPRTRVSVL